MSLQATTCPPGFDCAFLNSCPNAIVDCPPGYFCSSYEGFKHDGTMDYEFALFENLYNDEEVTRKNADNYADPYRAIQTSCLKGFYCPDAETMLPCPDGYWCSERTVVPRKCNDVSSCAEMSGFQVNFVNTLIMVLFVATALIASVFLTSRQKKRDTESRKKDPSARVATTNEQAPGVGSEKDAGLFAVSFDNITFSVTSTKRVILPSVRGNVPAGQITALMGPTACGKSTLLKILRSGGVANSIGTVQFTIQKATRTITLATEEAQAYIGHVPQEDVLDRNLTVRELFTFHARARCKGIKSSDEITAIVDEVLSDLSIQHVADSIIGGGENQAANISGGQLKRVNIGCELVTLTKPALLLLDEPTAGLDAAIAYELMQTLEQLKRRGITIFMVIQQPRAEIFERFDHLFLMNMCGGIAYEGTSSNAVPYLHHLGYAPNPEANDADYCLDVLNGLCDSATGRALVSHEHYELTPGNVVLDSLSLHVYWSQQQNEESADVEGVHVTRDTSPKTVGGGGGITMITEPSPSDTKKDRLTSSMRVITAGADWNKFFYHTYLNAQRLILVRVRNRHSLLIYVFVDFVMAIGLGVAFTIYLADSYLGILNPPVDTVLQGYYPAPLQKFRDWNVSSMALAQLLFFMSSSLGSAAALSGVPVFAGQAELAKREHQAGISIWSFSLGRMVADVIFVALNAFVYAGVWGLFGHPGFYYDWLGVILPTAFAASAIGYITSAAYPVSTASTWAIVAACVSSVFAGVEPTLRQVSQYPVVSWPWYLNFATWTAEATYSTWSRYLDNDGHVPISLEDGAEQYGFSVDGGLARAVGAMMALGVALRLVAMWVMYRRVKD